MNMVQNNAEKECMNIYNNGMTKAIKDKFLSNSEMDNLHKEFAAEALKVFDNLPHFGNQEQLKNAKLECVKTIEASEFKSRMEEKVKSHMNTELSNAEKECIMIYNVRMTDGTKGKLLNNAEMEKLHNECKSAALEEFDNLPDFGNRDQIKNAKSQCSKMIEASDYKSRMEEKVKSDMSTQQNNAEKECMIIYNDEMKRGTEEKYLNKAEMDNLHKECVAEALKVFDLFPDFGNQDQIKIAKAQCSKMQGSTLITQAKFDCLENYNDNMRRVIRNKTLSNSEMDKEHMECVASALKLFDNLPNFVNTEEIRIAKSNCSQMMKTCEYKSVMEGKMKDKLQKILEQSKNNYTNSLKQHAKNSEDIETFKEQASQCRKGFMNAQYLECEDNFINKRSLEALEAAKNTPNASPPEENKGDELAKGLAEDAILATAGLATGPAAPFFTAGLNIYPFKMHLFIEVLFYCISLRSLLFIRSNIRKLFKKLNESINKNNVFKKSDNILFKYRLKLTKLEIHIIC
ncbi:hypothetical protein B566_EDAN013346 [Ephemera danica]|nr:hypothetical protein B566_EDAN013346 [Ephemera danica]